MSGRPANTTGRFWVSVVPLSSLSFRENRRNLGTMIASFGAGRDSFGARGGCFAQSRELVLRFCCSLLQPAADDRRRLTSLRGFLARFRGGSCSWASAMKSSSSVSSGSVYDTEWIQCRLARDRPTLLARLLPLADRNESDFFVGAFRLGAFSGVTFRFFFAAARAEAGADRPRFAISAPVFF